MSDIQQLHVLLVEDSRTYAMAIQAHIEDWGHRVTHARSGEEALQHYHSALPDMILMDVIMPGMGGIEATRQIRKIQTDRWIPIIMMTSLGGDDDVIHGLEVGADEYLIKPLRFDVLRARVRAMQRTANLQRNVQEMRQQLVQNEKMASIGQLAAGVAHEINNPIGFVLSNIGALDKYVGSLFKMLGAYENAMSSLPALPHKEHLSKLCKEMDIEYLKEDIPPLIAETKDGISRVQKIVQNLKDFSHIDSVQDFHPEDLHKCIDSTLNIASNELGDKLDLIKKYGDLPMVECIPSQLNQVFMSLAINAGQAMTQARGQLVIQTHSSKDHVWITFTDNGCGMSPDILPKIFDPFFTTKPIGKGTGLGLSLAYGIVKKHMGMIRAESEIGKGSTFHIKLPIRQLPASSSDTTPDSQ